MKKRKITIVIAGDVNYKAYVEQGKRYSEKLGYEVLAYDLGGLGFGLPFKGRFTDNANAKIPCKPHIIMDALARINDDDFVVWLDADALIYQHIDEIAQDYDIGVTLRAAKLVEHSLPINAGIVFVRKSPMAAKFVSEWANLSDQHYSDQPPLNALCSVGNKDRHQVVNRDGVLIKVWPCEIYNNFYFAKKPSAHAKILHYKTKLRNLYPLGK